MRLIPYRIVGGTIGGETVPWQDVGEVLVFVIRIIGLTSPWAHQEMDVIPDGDPQVAVDVASVPV